VLCLRWRAGTAGAARLDVDTFTPLALVRRLSDAVLHCSYLDAVSTDWYFAQQRLTAANTDTASRKSVYNTCTCIAFIFYFTAFAPKMRLAA